MTVRQKNPSEAKSSNPQPWFRQNCHCFTHECLDNRGYRGTEPTVFWGFFSFLLFLKIYCRGKKNLNGFSPWRKLWERAGATQLWRPVKAEQILHCFISTCPQSALCLASFICKNWSPFRPKGDLCRKLWANSLNGNCSGNLIMAFAVKCKLVAKQWEQLDLQQREARYRCFDTQMDPNLNWTPF